MEKNQSFGRKDKKKTIELTIEWSRMDVQRFFLKRKMRLNIMPIIKSDTNPLMKKWTDEKIKDVTMTASHAGQIFLNPP